MKNGVTVHGILLTTLAMGCLFTFGCQGGKETIGKLLSVKGDVKARFSTKKEFSDAVVDTPLAVGGAVKTGKDSGAEISIEGKGQVALRAESFFEVQPNQLVGKQGSGTAIYRFQKQKEQIKIETPQGVTSVLGTTFLLLVASETTTVVVDEGKVAFTNMSGESAEIAAKEKLVAKAGGKLDKPEAIDPMTRNSFFGSGGSGPLFNQH